LSADISLFGRFLKPGEFPPIPVVRLMAMKHFNPKAN
jgi:hypothetical protein